ncbi:uncharacterized protein At5g08430-like [Zingiber officinale]|uniref:uncharacterized protein At5g08430-like n=1 Tax=Zingiber officinale TaxID=94328 RepID=UPI001C4CD365|nr:uncharacterized protein At5g08430-like [Zingiber officinale]
MKRKRVPEEEIADDYCFVCKDGGHLMVCDFKHCLKSYHPECVGKEPSILESEESWICDWHSCFICRKKSAFQCYCCPSSVCRHCLKDAEFVKFKKRTKGFCINCLKIAMLAEENIAVDSDGEKVDFKDIETYEFLFKEYWDIIKDKEGLTLADLQSANAALKRGKHLTGESDSDKLAEEDAGYDACENEADDDDDDDDDILPLVNLKRGRGRPRKHLARPKSKKRVFLGWGSTELINFLTSVGKDTEEPITQLDANEIIKDYIHKNNLFDPHSSKKIAVLCDDKLYALLGKKKVKYYKLYSMLENHFYATDESDEELSISSEEGDHSIRRCKREKKPFENKNLNWHPKSCQKNAFAPPEICYASIVGKNINAVYLKRSLFVELLKTPDTFDGKVTGCFVRVKLDRKDFEFTPAKMYKLGQVLGVKKSLETYKIGEMLTDIVLCVSNFHKDVQISRLSEDDFEEEECEELCQLANKGLFKRSTVTEFEKKIISIHADRMNHWIDKEIVRLQRLIDRANDKGWRRELFEYIDQREKLKTSAERQRLLQEIPRVIVDTQPFEGNTQSPITEKKEDKAVETTKSDMATGCEVVEVED